MATSLLVGPDIAGGERLLQALAQQRLPITAAFWLFPKGPTPWRLYVVSPLVDVEGSLPFYARLQTVLRSLPSVGISLTEVVATGERDPIVRHLRRAIPSDAEARLPATVTLPTYITDFDPFSSADEPARLYVYQLVPGGDRRELEEFARVLTDLRDRALANSGALPPEVVLVELCRHSGERFDRYHRAFRENTSAPVQADTLEGIRRAAEDLLQ